jgi:HEAT repeat protein
MRLHAYLIQLLIFLSLAYLASSFFMPETQQLLWLTGLLIVLNYSLSLSFLFRQGHITVNLILLNVIQLGLFSRLHHMIYQTLDQRHYAYIEQPQWFDWIELVAIHVLRAVDLLDILGAYGITLQNLTHQSLLSGFILFSMHIMVDIFLLGAIVMFIKRRTATQHANTLLKHAHLVAHFKNTPHFIKQLRFWALLFAIVLIISVAIKQNWPVWNSLLWPLDNILRTLDFGDAFQIFDWQLHTVDMNIGLATLAVFFRLVISAYALEPLNRIALYLLKGRGKTVDELVKICTSSEYSKETHQIAIKALVGFQPKISVPSLLKALEKTDNNQTHVILIEALGEIGPAAKAAIPHLVKLRIDQDKGIRWAAMIALEERIAPHWAQNEAVIRQLPHLIKGLRETNNEVRCAAAEVLGEIGPAATIAIPDLVKALTNNNHFVYRAIVCALENIEPNLPIKPLLKTEGLEKISPNNARVIPHLLKALKDKDWEVRQTALIVLGKIGPLAEKIALSSIINVLNDNRHQVRYAAITALGQIAQANNHIILPYLIKGLSDQNSDVRCAAAQSLGKIGETSLTAIPELIKALIDKHENVRNAANTALNQIDPYWARRTIAHPAIPYLIKALNNDNPSKSSHAAEILAKMGRNAGLAVPDLMKTLLSCQDESMRWAIEAALNQIDPKGKLRKKTCHD